MSGIPLISACCSPERHSADQVVNERCRAFWGRGAGLRQARDTAVENYKHPAAPLWQEEADVNDHLSTCGVEHGEESSLTNLPARERRPNHRTEAL